jgi:hypothetical protein
MWKASISISSQRIRHAAKNIGSWRRSFIYSPS